MANLVNSLRVKNFRCFHSRQAVPLAPLTLLVGENSTGKTSFMALIHALNGIMASDHPTISWKDSYDLGNFDQIVYGNENHDPVNEIEAGYTIELTPESDLSCDFVFESNDDVPFTVNGILKYKDVWVSTIQDKRSEDTVTLHIRSGRKTREVFVADSSLMMWPSQFMQIVRFLASSIKHDDAQFLPQPELASLKDFQDLFDAHTFRRSYAAAPTRSKPRRTYDLISSSPEWEGVNVPLNLATLSRGDQESWEKLQSSLQEFGRSAELFDEIIVKNYGEGGPDDPFQVLVKEFIRGGDGQFRNLVDVGYGISQIMPIVTELERREQTPMFLLQQPEIHLHPIAQAALGDFFCDFVSRGKQLVVETHSDYIVDRIRMNVRDGEAGLSVADVLILFFEREGTDVKIHPIRFDKEGNVLNTPDGYRRFFMEEMDRSIGW